MAFSAGFGPDITDIISQFDVAIGEVDNVHEAFLRDVSELVAQTMADNWPLGDRSKPWQQGIHSADLWTAAQIEQLVFEVQNSASYAQWVHHRAKYGGPPGLAERELPGILAQVEADPLAYATDRVLQLLGA